MRLVFSGWLYVMKYATFSMWIFHYHGDKVSIELPSILKWAGTDFSILRFLYLTCEHSLSCVVVP